MRAGRAADLLADLTQPLTRRTCLTHIEQRPARAGRAGSFPEWTDPRLVAHLAERGITAPWIHQEQAARLAHGGQHVVLATATASGKSLAYLLPLLTAIGARELDPEARRATALYLSPTKALAADQLVELRALSDAARIGLKTHTYDGDTPPNVRSVVRAAGQVVITNPDMLHAAILPHHTKWFKLFENLRYVVIDELHTYRGLFGSHVANVVRRLRRICRHYGSDPVFICASATIANPGELAERILEDRPAKS